MKKLFFMLCAVAFTSHGSHAQFPIANGTKKTASDAAKPHSSAGKSADVSIPESSWVYAMDTDKMTSKRRYYAGLVATNKLDFAFPYDGGSTGALNIGNVGNGNVVMLLINNGQFLTGENHPMYVKFDNSAPMTFNSTRTSAVGQNTLLLYPVSKFISYIKKARKMLVRAEFYQNGYQEMEFDVAALKWNH
jgi:hypothetical protein